MEIFAGSFSKIVLTQVLGLLDPLAALASFAAFVFWRSRIATIAAALVWKSLLFFGVLYLARASHTPFQDMTGFASKGVLWFCYLVAGYFLARFMFWLCTKLAMRPWAKHSRLLGGAVLSAVCVVALVAVGVYRLANLPISVTIRPELVRYVLTLSEERRTVWIDRCLPNQKCWEPPFVLVDSRLAALNPSTDDLASIVLFILELRHQQAEAMASSLSRRDVNHALGFQIAVVALIGGSLLWTLLRIRRNVRQSQMRLTELYPMFIPGVVVAGMLAVSLFPWPYGYFMLLRLVVFAASIWFAAAYYQRDQRWVLAVFIPIAILFNPLFPLEFERGAWAAIDVATIVPFVVATLCYKATQRP